MAAGRGIRKRDVGLLALRARAGERVALLLGRRRYTLTVDPIFRIQDGADGFIFLCSGLESLGHRLDALADRGAEATAKTDSELGGAQGLQ
ncbi:MAG TPA: hypothetical protein VKL61_00520 [Candidatus Polarisedimenticolia bacterium]|nr:hypothetical protein [Candidatus Polarisedimenticolia bacterium]